jgi:HSP20 family protein
MLNRWSDIDRTAAAMSHFRRRMDRLFDEIDTVNEVNAGSWPRAQLFDRGPNLILHAEVPGLADKDIKLTLNQDVLTIEGERPVTAPEGFSVHRQERASVRFARSVTLPCKVDVERVTASVRDGVLSVTLPKTPESQPRRIAVNSQS